jgi:RNA polymerase sigma factor (sigma-70 family)
MRGGEQDHRNRAQPRILPTGLDEGPPTHYRHEQIQDNDVRDRLTHSFQCLGTVFRLVHGVPDVAQVPGNGLADGPLVFDHQHPTISVDVNRFHRPEGVSPTAYGANPADRRELTNLMRKELFVRVDHVHARSIQTMHPGDGPLVRACRKGDQAAWETLVRRYQRLVHTIPLRAGLDEQGAADVLQDVFAALVQRLDTIEEPDRVGAWIVTTAKRMTWRAIRQRRDLRTSETALELEAEEVPDVEPLPEHVLARLEEQHEVRTALDALDERCRRLLTMLFYARAETPPYSAIAHELGIAEGSIGPIRARCLERLLRQLG